MKRKVSVTVIMGLFFVLFGFTVKVNAAEMQRLYNPNTGEHFYTQNMAEKTILNQAGWDYEGVGWYAPDNGDPVYRMYNRNSGDHHYTMDANEKNALILKGWSYEGIGWYSDVDRKVPLYRAYNKNTKAGSHNYTTNKAEQDSLVKAGWKNEGIGWYAVKEGYSVAVPSKPKPTNPTPSQPTPTQPAETVYVNAQGQGLIKGSKQGIYHVPGSKYYNKTTNVVRWFKTVSEAQAAGYRAPIN